MNNDTDKNELKPTEAFEPTEEGYDPKKEKKAHIGWVIFFSVMVVASGYARTTCTAQTCGLSRLGSIVLAVEVVEIAYNILIAEVEHQSWVEGYTAETCLEVQV